MSALKNKYCHLLFGVFKGVNTSYDICMFDEGYPYK